MTEQERPRTEAGQNFLARANLLHYEEDIEASDQIMAAVLAIEAEGRQQAVREIERVIRDELMMASDDTGSDQFEQGALAAYNHVLGSLPVGVAGLNASETMHDAFCILSRDHGGACDIPGLNASESGQPPEEHAPGCDGNCASLPGSMQCFA